MRKLLTIGLHIRHKARLHGRLKDVEFRSANDKAEALAILETEKMDMIVVDESIDNATAFLELVKGMEIPTIFCAESQKSTAYLRSLVVGLGVSVVLIKPIDPDELVRRAGELLLAVRTKEHEADPLIAEMSQRLTLMWERFAPANRDRVSWLKTKILDLVDGGTLDESVRREMEREAHKLVGALGTFGFPGASVIAREVELHVSPTKGKPMLDPSQLLEWVQDIARDISKDPEAPKVTATEATPGAQALVISEDQELTDLLQTLTIQGQPLKIEVVASWSRARESWFLHAPDLVIVDLCGELREERQTLLRALGARLSTIPVLTLLPREIWSEPEALANFAGSPVLFHPYDQYLLTSALTKLLAQEKRRKPRLLAVDDDPQILAAIDSLLQPLKLDITTLSDPLEFWDTLEATQPDLLMLDLDMPFLSGIELCRGVRSSARWCDLPILFLSASSDSETIHRLFSVGADDFVKKPFSGPELATRVVNRIVRSAAPHQSRGDDVRVGSGLNSLRSVLLEEEERGREVALALLRIRNEADLRQTHGTAAIAVLNRQFGVRLADQLRDLGTVTRWRSGEYLIALPGQTLEGVQQQLGLLLASPHLYQMGVGESLSVNLRFAIGLTTLPPKTSSLEAALRTCQHNLAQAEAGNTLVVGTEPGTDVQASQAEHCELLILEPSEKIGCAVEKLMIERGFACRWIPETELAVNKLTSNPPTLETQVVFISSGGLELLTKLGPITRLVNIVVAVSNDAEFTTAFDKGAFDCVEKPCKVTTLVRRLERAFEF